MAKEKELPASQDPTPPLVTQSQVPIKPKNKAEGDALLSAWKDLNTLLKLKHNDQQLEARRVAFEKLFAPEGI